MPLEAGTHVCINVLGLTGGMLANRALENLCYLAASSQAKPAQASANEPKIATCGAHLSPPQLAQAQILEHFSASLASPSPPRKRTTRDVQWGAEQRSMKRARRSPLQDKNVALSVTLLETCSKQ